jgi:hypothetical protein
MEITPEIEKIFATRPDEIKGIELTYLNGGTVTGSIRKIRHSPLRLFIQKSAPQKGERARHKVVFDHVTQLGITFTDGTVNRFSEADIL